MKIIASFVGMLLMVLGVLTFFTPIPIGILLFACGLSLLICFNPQAQNILRTIRTNHHRVNTKITALEGKIESRLNRLHVHLIKTRPTVEDNKPLYK